METIPFDLLPLLASFGTGALRLTCSAWLCALKDPRLLRVEVAQRIKTAEGARAVHECARSLEEIADVFEAEPCDEFAFYDSMAVSGDVFALNLPNSIVVPAYDFALDANAYFVRLSVSGRLLAFADIGRYRLWDLVERREVFVQNDRLGENLGFAGEALVGYGEGIRFIQTNTAWADAPALCRQLLSTADAVVSLHDVCDVRLWTLAGVALKKFACRPHWHLSDLRAFDGVAPVFVHDFFKTRFEAQRYIERLTPEGNIDVLAPGAELDVSLDASVWAVENDGVIALYKNQRIERCVVGSGPRIVGGLLYFWRNEGQMRLAI